MDEAATARIRSVLRARATLLAEFEAEEQRGAPDVALNYRIFETLRREAVALGVLPGLDPLDGIERDVAFVRVMHGRRAP